MGEGATPTPPDRTPSVSISRPRLVFGVVLLWALIFGLAAAATEWILRSRYLRIAASDRLSPGLTLADPTLGWRLQPDWKGRHAHHDFDVAYSINAWGFRGLDARTHRPPARSIAILGDSFTFGIGVDDEEVFTHLLNRRLLGSHRVYNFSVPGYSTDQELLLAERQVLGTRPDVLVLVVYLANDLFDNQLTMPLQVRREKPRFVPEGDGLALMNSPVPDGPVDRTGQPQLLDMILGNRPEEAHVRQRLEGRSHLFRLLSENVLPQPADDPAFDRRFAPALGLFWGIVERLQRGCATSRTRCVLAVMAGRSFVESPSSLSAQFQDFFRRRLVGGAAERRIALIDVGGELRSRYRRLGGRWFHPNEGHLNADGHRVVAGLFEDAMATLDGRSR
jgi:lysophospholipase L1-like esterase